MRLIDADALIKRINTLYEWCQDERKSGLEQAMGIVYEQPTVYDECAKKEAVEITVECIKKHIPKKPIVSKIVMFSITNGECKEEVVSHYHCPVCGRIVYKYDCCADNNCRQKIDWSDEE